MCVGVCFVVVIRIRRIWKSLCLLVLTRDKNTSAGLCTCEIETPPRESLSGYEWKIVKFGEFNFDKYRFASDGEISITLVFVACSWPWVEPWAISTAARASVVRTTIAAAAAAEESLTGVRIKFIWLGTFMVAKFLVQPAAAVDSFRFVSTEHDSAISPRKEERWRWWYFPYLTIASDWLMNLYRIRNSNALSFGGW